MTFAAVDPASMIGAGAAGITGIAGISWIVLRYIRTLLDALSKRVADLEMLVSETDRKHRLCEEDIDLFRYALRDAGVPVPHRTRSDSATLGRIEEAQRVAAMVAKDTEDRAVVVAAAVAAALARERAAVRDALHSEAEAVRKRAEETPG